MKSFYLFTLIACTEILSHQENGHLKQGCQIVTRVIVNVINTNGRISTEITNSYKTGDEEAQPISLPVTSKHINIFNEDIKLQELDSNLISRADIHQGKLVQSSTIRRTLPQIVIDRSCLNSSKEDSSNDTILFSHMIDPMNIKSLENCSDNQIQRSTIVNHCVHPTQINACIATGSELQENQSTRRIDQGFV